MVAASSTGPGNIQLATFVNGAVGAILASGYVSVIGAQLYMNGSAMLNLNRGDYVEMGVLNSSTNPFIYTVNPSSSYIVATFTVERVAL